MHNHTLVNLNGKRFGHLLVIGLAPRMGRQATMWLCRCDCNRLKVISAGSLTVKKGPFQMGVRTCGQCQFARLVKSESATRHGMAHSQTYRVWSRMKSRCEAPSYSSFEHYGGRGIRVCKRWQRFENFLADMGEIRSGMSLERIDVNGNYEPSNCCWIPLKEQARNRRNSLVLETANKRLSAKDIAEQSGIHYLTIVSRMNKGVCTECLSRHGYVMCRHDRHNYRQYQEAL